VWATLETDTQSVARGDTDRPGHVEEIPDEEEDEQRPSRVARRAPERDNGGWKLIIFLLLGVLLLAGIAVGGFYAIRAFSKRTDPTPPLPPPPPNTHKITVSKAGGENTVPTLRQALEKASPGDTIVIAEPKLVEPSIRLDKTRYTDLTIESGLPDGKPAVIEFLPPSGGKGGIMLDVWNVEGVRVRNIEFDGKGQAERGIQLFNTVPGATFEGVTVRNVQKSGFYLWNVTGSKERPIVLDRVRVILTRTCDGGVVSFATGVLENKHIDIKNSRFEGPGNAGVRLDGPVLDLEMTNNRFYNLNAAVWFVRPSGKISKGTFTNNTVYQAAVGLNFEVPPPPKPDPKAPKAPPPPPPTIQYEWEVRLNYFARTGELMRLPSPVATLTAENNFTDAASTPGNPPLAATKLDAPTLPSPNPNDDATFLRFPGNTAPTAGPNNQRVGAQ
jgi:hypothetical protein